MFKILVASCVLALATAAPGGTRIVGGEPINIEEVPYQVAVGSYDSSTGTIKIWCGGSIVSKLHIVTASHCFNDHDINTEDFTIFAGMTRLDQISFDMLVPVASVKLHELYNKVTHNYDIAILTLSEPLGFNNKIHPVDLPNFEDLYPVGEYAYASGWGKLSEGGSSATQLQGVVLEMLTPAHCDMYSNFDYTYMICAGAIDGTVDTCQGDSGGPLVYENVLWGVTSFGRGCARPGYPGVYANVAYLRDFIYENTGI